jgi:hypothetical protein
MSPKDLPPNCVWHARRCIYSVSCGGCFVFVDESAEEVAPADLGG